VLRSLLLLAVLRAVLRAVLLAALPAALLTAPLPVRAQVTAGEFQDTAAIPATPAGARMRELIEVVNQGDGAALAAFVETRTTPALRGEAGADELTSFLGTMHDLHGTLAFHAERRFPARPMPDGMVAIVRTERSQRWLGIMITIEPAPPHRIATLMFNAARPPVDAVDRTPIDEEELARELDAYLAPLAARQAFSGSVLVARGDRVLFARGYGEADRDKGIPNRPETRFGLSSMGKMFTAVAIAQLAEQGKLALDDPLDRYLGRGWLSAADRRAITLRQLLSHTAGTGDFLADPRFTGARGKYRRVDDYKPLLADAKLAFPPGTRFQYSNSGFILLGAVIEKVSGRPYQDTVRGAIWGPAGMTATGCADLAGGNAEIAVGYYQDREGDRTVWRNTLSTVPRFGSPAGGCVSTVLDLQRFERALRGGKLISAAMLETLWTDSGPRGTPSGYGLGFDLGGTPGDRVAGHGGSFPGAYGAFDIYRDRDALVVVLSNGNGIGSAQEKARELVSRLPVP